MNTYERDGHVGDILTADGQWLDADFVRKYAEFESSGSNKFEQKVNGQSILDMIPPSAQTILDFGCGNGYFGEKIATTLQKKVFGHDIAEEMRQIASQKIEVLERWQLADCKFDAIIMKLMLHYVPNIDELFAELRGYLSDTGSIIVSMPNPQRTAASENRRLDETWTYTNKIAGQDDLVCMMIHRPFGAVIDEFGKNGLYLEKFEELVDRTDGRTDILPKRVNFRVGTPFGMQERF